jgi:hypothetical protein
MRVDWRARRGGASGSAAMSRRALCAADTALLFLFLAGSSNAADPLPSWNEGAAKSATRSDVRDWMIDELTVGVT